MKPEQRCQSEHNQIEALRREVKDLRERLEEVNTKFGQLLDLYVKECNESGSTVHEPEPVEFNQRWA